MYIHSVAWIVALITVRANMCACLRKLHAHAAHCFLHSSSHFLTFKPAFSVWALIFFSKFPHVKNRVYRWIMHKNYSINFFWLWWPQSFTHMVYGALYFIILLCDFEEQRVSGKNTLEVRDLSLSESPTKTKKFYIILDEQKRREKQVWSFKCYCRKTN